MIQTTNKTSNVIYMTNLEVLMVPSVQYIKGEQQFKYHIFLNYRTIVNKRRIKFSFFYTAFLMQIQYKFFILIIKVNELIFRIIISTIEIRQTQNLLYKLFYFGSILLLVKELEFFIISFYYKLNNNNSTALFRSSNNCDKKMDFFDIPDDYVPEKPLTDEQFDDINNYLKNHPLFMTQLPKNFQQNQHLVALQDLIDHQDVNVSAESLCQQGSQYIKKNANNKHYLKIAHQKYTQAINLQPSKQELLAKLHCNRALINLKNKNYGKVIIDCRITIKYDPNYTKAYYRCAQAYIAVKRFKQTIQLLKDRTEPELLELRKQAESKIQKQKKVEQIKVKKQQKKINQVSQYCLSKKYNVIKRTQPLPQDAKIQLIDGKLSIPILFAYPQFCQMDLVAKTKQQQKIKTYISQLFESPLPWDDKKQYNMNSCELFFQFSEDKIMRIPKTASIQQIAKRVPMKGAIQIVILAKNNTFYNIYLKDKQVI